MRSFVRSAVALGAAAAFSAGAQAQTTLNMQATWPASLTLYENFLYFADRINKISGGQFKINTMPAGRLHVERRLGVRPCGERCCGRKRDGRTDQYPHDFPIDKRGTAASVQADHRALKRCRRRRVALHHQRVVPGNDVGGRFRQRLRAAPALDHVADVVDDRERAALLQVGVEMARIALPGAGGSA